MSDLGRELDKALADAHLPALIASMVHITGDASWLKPEWRPTYTPMSRNDIGLSESVQAEIRAAAGQVLADYLEGGKKLPPPPPVAVIREMMDFVGGTPIPETYVDFLLDELALTGRSS